MVQHVLMELMTTLVSAFLDTRDLIVKQVRICFIVNIRFSLLL